MKGLIVALQFLTRLPMPRVAVSSAEFAASMRWFPAAGLVVGGIVAGGVWAGGALDPWVAAIIGLALWVGVTGALHLDGLGDIADAAGAAHKGRERLLTVLADPHVGSFAVVTIGLQLAAKLVLLHAMAQAHLLLPIVLIPFAARIGPFVWTRILPSLHDGLGARFRDSIRPRDLALWSAALLAGVLFAPGLIATPALIWLWALWLRSRIGGISGDGHGAGIELVETGLLLATLIAARIA